MAVDFTGKWHNQHGSEMDLSVSANGKLSGTYQTRVGSPQPSERFDLVGFVADDLIAFTVNFGKHGSLTSWTGQHSTDNGADAIHAMWHLAVEIEETEQGQWLWYGIRSGCDTFLRGPHPTGTSALKRAPSHPVKRQPLR